MQNLSLLLNIYCSSFKLKVYRGIFEYFVIDGIIFVYSFHVNKEADMYFWHEMEHIKRKKVP